VRLATICIASGTGSVDEFDYTTPTSWTLHAYNYTATSSILTIRFALRVDIQTTWFLDDVSLTNVNSSSEMLINGDFENETLTGWITQSCSTACQPSVNTSSLCFGGSGSCYLFACFVGSNDFQFLQQSVSAMNGAQYLLSFWLNRAYTGPHGPVTQAYLYIY
jgi:hypothetical protein